jgi:hypothetical protein
MHRVCQKWRGGRERRGGAGVRRDRASEGNHRGRTGYERAGREITARPRVVAALGTTSSSWRENRHCPRTGTHALRPDDLAWATFHRVRSKTMASGRPITGLAAKPWRVPIRRTRWAGNRSPSVPNRRAGRKTGVLSEDSDVLARRPGCAGAPPRPSRPNGVARGVGRLALSPVSSLGEKSACLEKNRRDSGEDSTRSS